VHAVHRSADWIEGIECLHSVLDLPEAVDVAVIAVPPPQVVAVAADCGRRGVRNLVVITSNLGADGGELLSACRRYGMRLVGPNCFGIAVPAAGLNATFALRQPRPGAAGLVMQPADWASRCSSISTGLASGCRHSRPSEISTTSPVMTC
jgi:acyl-CoA synthetase (NDP forming)